MWYIHTVECCSKQEVLIHAATWMSLANMLSDRSQSQNITYYMIHLYEISRTGKFTEKRKEIRVTSRLGREGIGGDCLLDMGFFVV